MALAFRREPIDAYYRCNQTTVERCYYEHPSQFRRRWRHQAHRNVLTRAERIQKLKAEGRWDKEKGIFNLPKVRSIKGV